MSIICRYLAAQCISNK